MASALFQFSVDGGSTWLPVDTAVAGGQILTSLAATTADVRVRLASTAGLNTPPTWSVTSRSPGAATLTITHNADKSATIPVSRASAAAYLLRCVVNGGTGQAGGDTRSLSLKVATASGLELLAPGEGDESDRTNGWTGAYNALVTAGVGGTLPFRLSKSGGTWLSGDVALVEGSNVTLTVDAALKTITIASTGGGGSALPSPWTATVDGSQKLTVTHPTATTLNDARAILIQAQSVNDLPNNGWTAASATIKGGNTNSSGGGGAGSGEVRGGDSTNSDPGGFAVVQAGSAAGAGSTGGYAFLTGGAGASTGGDATVTGGAGTGTNANGGAAAVAGGASTGTGAAGGISLTGGYGATGGAVTVTGGGSSLGQGGGLTFAGGFSYAANPGGPASFSGGGSVGEGGEGGAATLKGGDGAPAGTNVGGGFVYVRGGASRGTSAPGIVSVIGGQAGGSAAGGTLALFGGQANSGPGGAVQVIGGASASGAPGGVNVTGGAGTGTAAGGATTIAGGASGATGVGGVLICKAGATTAGTGPVASFRGGDGTTAGGAIQIAGGAGTAKGKCSFGYMSGASFVETCSWDHTTFALPGAFAVQDTTAVGKQLSATQILTTATVTATLIYSYAMATSEVVSITYKAVGDNGTTAGAVVYEALFRRAVADAAGAATQVGTTQDVSLNGNVPKGGHALTIALNGNTIEVKVVAAAATSTLWVGAASIVARTGPL